MLIFFSIIFDPLKFKNVRFAKFIFWSEKVVVGPPKR